MLNAIGRVRPLAAGSTANQEEFNEILGMKKTALFAFLIAPLMGHASAFIVNPVTVEVPVGFEGPVRQEQEGAVVVGFTKRSGPVSNTLLQITVYNLGSKLEIENESLRAVAASKFLLDFLGGVERRRIDFNRTEPVALKISGIPAAKLEWTGKLQGQETVGDMYSFVVDTYVIIFHTQDIGTTPSAAMNEAMRAFESARVTLITNKAEI